MINRFQRRLFLPLLLLVPFVVADAQTRKSEYLDYLKNAADAGWRDYPRAVEDWRKNIPHHELWGYDGPGQPIYLADTLAYLYQQTNDRSYAEKARDILVGYGDLRASYPNENRIARAEYRNGVPAISNFFIMPPYVRAYLRVRESGVIDATARAKIERDLAGSLDFIFHFPEWGAHNRAMLRAESLYYGALALADHPQAKRWKQLAETLAYDSLKQWEIEDATGYHGVWLYSLFSYADISGREDVLASPMVKYYLDYFTQLLTPHGNFADFGDAHWNGGWERFVPVFEKAATLYRNPQYKFVAQELTKRYFERTTAPGKPLVVSTGIGSPFTDAHRWADDAVKAEKPTSRSQDVLEDLIGKKVVFRNGWERASTMMLLNYRDEGDGGLLGRDYLRQTLSVEEEKMHHGHADENSIALLMSGGSVLLHDGGYRPDLPSGPAGEWRADYFHNRLVARREKRGKNQDVFEFVRNAGAYRRVRTQKLDFLSFKDADISRTRLLDEQTGWQWDRIVAYVKAKDLFVVIDGIKVLRADYYTFTNLWHTRQIINRGANFFDTRIDQIQTDVLPDARALTIHFPESTNGKQAGTFNLTRHFQDETAIYQTVASSYKAGDTEFFVTVLAPHDRRADYRFDADRFRLLEVDQPGQAVGVMIDDGAEKTVLCVKLDLAMDLARENIGPRYVYRLGKVRYGEFETDASALFATIKDGQIGYGAATMTKVLYRNQVLMEALPNTFGLQLDGAPPRTGYAKWRFWEDTVRVR